MKTLLALAGLSLLAAGCSDGARASATAAAPPGVPVSVAKAERRDVPARLRAVGTVESPASVTITPRIDGQIAQIVMQEGADVKEGDLLIVIDRAPFEAALHAAEAALARDSAMAEDARRNSDSWNSLSDSRAASQRAVEQAKAASDAADATVSADKAALEAAKLSLSWCEVRAPFAGRTGRVEVRTGSGVKARETELVTLRQIAPIRVSFAVPEDRLAEIRAKGIEGEPDVEVSLPGGGSAHGKLGFVDNSVDASTGTILLMAELPNEDHRLWPGQLVDVAITVAVTKDAVVVPMRAVQPSQSGDSIFVVGADGAVELRTVKVARIDGDTAEIAEGLKGDETVVTDGQLRLVPGTHVTPKAEAPKADAP
jgi:membrane fusion protein, multidrug efflux system